MASSRLMGIPCLVSDIPENTQLLEKFGASFAHGDPAALAEALNRALQAPPPAGEAQAEYIRQNYSWEKNARDTLALYQRAAARRR